MKVKKQIGKTGNRGSGKTCIKRDQEREEEIWRGSRRQPPPPPPPTGHPSFSDPAHSREPHQRVRVWDTLCGDGGPAQGRQELLAGAVVVKLQLLHVTYEHELTWRRRQTST